MKGWIITGIILVLFGLTLIGSGIYQVHFITQTHGDASKIYWSTIIQFVIGVANIVFGVLCFKESEGD